MTVQDSGTQSPIQRASVLADGPKSLSGVTEKDGRVKFGDVKEGDYTIRASAAGYLPSAPETIKVKKKTEHTVRLERTPPSASAGAGAQAPPAGPKVEGVVGPGEEGKAQQPQAQVAPAIPQVSVPAGTPVAEPVAQQPVQQEPAELEGWGGERIREIIKTFQAKGAISPETALTAKELGLSRVFVRIMQRRRGRTRIFIEINGKYYLDQKALEEMK